MAESFQQLHLEKQLESYAHLRKFDAEKIMRACKIASQQHCGQVRKTGEDYIIHPLRVAQRVTMYSGSQDSVIAAILHDVIEDTKGYGLEKIESDFGVNVAIIVSSMSKKTVWKTCFAKAKSNLDEMESVDWSNHNVALETIMLKILDRLDNIETLHGLSIKKQQEQIKETKEDLIPFFDAFSQKYKNEGLEKPLQDLKLAVKKMNPNEQVTDINAKMENFHIVKFKGISGIKKAYEEVLAWAISRNEPILAYESTADANQIDKEDKFFAYYIEKRVQNKVLAKVICPDTKEDRQYKRESEGTYTKIKLDPKFVTKVNTNIVGDLEMTFTLNPPEGTITIHQQKAELQKHLFKRLWILLK